MRKLIVIPIVSVLIAAAGFAKAQPAAGCGGTVQSYQRFSYQPALAQSAMQDGGVAYATGAVPQVTVAPYSSPQVYQRYSFAPQSYYGAGGSYYGAGGGQRSNLWEYAKGDPRRYRP